MGRTVLMWHSGKDIFAKEPRLNADAKAVITSLNLIKDDFHLLDNSIEKTILTKLTLAVCGDAQGYRVYSNQMWCQSKEPRGKTKEAYQKAYSIITKHFKITEAGIRKKFANKEWLYDVHWYLEKDENKGDDFQKRIPNENDRFFPAILPLVAESEFDNSDRFRGKSSVYGETKYDFQKLLVANADLRLMVFRKDARIPFNSNTNIVPIFFTKIKIIPGRRI